MVFRSFAVLGLLIAVATFSSRGSIAQAAPATLAAASFPQLFTSEDAAQSHCPKDVVVWLNLPSGIYHYKGERWYGRTKHGAYVCEKEALATGDRASENGQ